MKNNVISFVFIFLAIFITNYIFAENKEEAHF